MTDTSHVKIQSDDPGPSGPSLFQRHRKIFFAAFAVVVIAVLWLAFRGSNNDKAEAAAETTPKVDSIMTLDSVAQRLAGIEVVTVGGGADNALVANGTITFDANRMSVVASRAEGRLLTVRADLGQSVAQGALLATVESSDVGATRADLDRAKASVEIAQRNYDREKRLYEQQITPQKELLEAEAALRSAEADVRSALARLNAIGATDAVTGEGATFGLASPVAGVVVERNASPGQSVGPSTNLFTVADLHNVWITVDIYEGDVARVRSGATAMVSPTAFPTDRFPGIVTFAGGVIDTASRTFKVRVEVANPNLRLRPGMFAQVRIPTSGGGSGQIVVPEIAVQDLAGKSVVFVAAATPGKFIVRNVITGNRSSGSIVVTSGLRAGERVVVKGAFQLRSELMKASFGGEE